MGSAKVIEFVADNPGDWLFHCHMTHHVMNQMGHDFPNPEALSRSRAVILNIDYPLGFGAYHLQQTTGERLHQWRGLFVLGKSAAMIERLFCGWIYVFSLCKVLLNDHPR